MDLRLNLKKRWYEMIECRIKNEEYRVIKEYWIKRLIDYARYEADKRKDSSIKMDDYIKNFDTVTFVYGYTKRTMQYKCNGIKLGYGSPYWGAEVGERYFVISIGERIA